MYSDYDVDRSKNKVYINPNFNKPAVSNNLMHVNPRFPHLLTNIQPKVNNTTKIHVNPNFVKSKSAVTERSSANVSYFQHETLNSYNYLHLQEKLQIGSQVVSVPTTQPHYQQYCDYIGQNKNIVIERPKTTIQLNKYKSVPFNSISIKNNNITIVSVPPVVDKPKTTTFQINRYKSVPLNDIKRRLDNAKNTLNKHVSEKQSIKQTNFPSQTLIQNQSRSTNISNSAAPGIPKINKFKLVNNKSQDLRNTKLKTQRVVDKYKKFNLSNQIRLNKIKGKLKKNNIPCPTFRKFGKCLRKDRGNCEFLHDKNHVAVCRKFIKGLCHDKDCTLSHDVTLKKMPTCYFYLKGTCTKPDCPYLHVKISEKVKICPDFLKGYCEKGSKCLQRHTNMHYPQKVKNSLVPLPSTAPKNSRLQIRKMETKRSVENKPLIEKNNSDQDRYYKENKDSTGATDEVCEVIKPTRCKLGSLPSFIQL